MTDDQITELARLLPPEAAPDLPADRLQILKEHLMLEYRLAAHNRFALRSDVGPGAPSSPPSAPAPCWPPLRRPRSPWSCPGVSPPRPARRRWSCSRSR